MFEKPWFQENIWQNFINFNLTYMTSRPWLYYLLPFFASLLILALILKKFLQKSDNYKNLFSENKYVFDKQNKLDWLALFTLIISIVFTEIYIFLGEHSLFENYDLMAINTTRSMRIGLVTNFDFVRVTPFAGWFLSSLYAITQNIILIKDFVLLQIFLMSWSLYAFFNYIPVAKRLFMIALIIIMPTFLQTTNIIFPERDMIIVVMLSLICIRKYSLTNNFVWAICFLFLLNIGCYIKEPCVFLYFGIMITSLFYHIYVGNVTIKNCINPFNIIKNMPLEFLIGFSLLVYYSIFIFLQQGENLYLNANNQSIDKQLATYHLELILMIISCCFLFFKNFKQKQALTNPMFRSGLIVGSLCTVFFIIVVFRLAPTTPHLAERSYYLLLPAIFFIAYIFENVSSWRWLAIFSIVLSIYSVYLNINYFNKASGKYYREIAEVMAENTSPKETNSIFIQEGPYRTKMLWQWIVETWSTSYRYYFNDRIFTFKSDIHYLDRNATQKLQLFNSLHLIYFPIIPQPLPLKEDWVIINKNNNSTKASNLRNEYKGNLVYENKLFEVYKPKQ